MSEPWSPMRAQRNTYAGYSVGCAGVWGLILLFGRRRLDPQTWDTLRLGCGGWWMGWTSATIARISYPAPISLILIALGFVSAARVFLAGRREGGTTPGA
jgi:hypothetical protein